MGCSNCGREMCDCPPWAGSSMSQDYSGLPNDFERSSLAFSDDHRINYYDDYGAMARNKDVWSLLSKQTRGFVNPFEMMVSSLIHAWGLEEAREIIRNNRRAVESYKNERYQFSTDESWNDFVNKLK